MMRSKKRSRLIVFATAVALGAILWALPSAHGDGPPPAVGHFELAATYQVSGGVAEIVASNPEGTVLIYTDSEAEEVGFVDITDPAAPAETGTLGVAGEPTSVAVTPDGRWALVAVHGEPDQLVVIDLGDRTVETAIPLGGQPDSVAVGPDGRYAAIAIENERDEDLNDGEMPQPPGGFLTIVDLVGAPAAWATRDVSLAGLAARFPGDPEPEFVDINADNQAAVTLQENNHVVIVDLAAGVVVAHWSAGTTTHAADTQDDGRVLFDDLLAGARLEPDAVAWTPHGQLITANEGDYDLDLDAGEFVGGRNFTVFTPAGAVQFDSGAEVETEAAAVGLYDDGRSDAKGCEIEGAEVGAYLNHTFAFLGAERCDFVAVYRLAGGADKPKFVQLLATGSRPEGLLALPRRNLFVSANEGDGTISIFAARPGNP